MSLEVLAVVEKIYGCMSEGEFGWLSSTLRFTADPCAMMEDVPSALKTSGVVEYVREYDSNSVAV